jgi:hypothetical protein
VASSNQAEICEEKGHSVAGILGYEPKPAKESSGFGSHMSRRKEDLQIAMSENVSHMAGEEFSYRLPLPSSILFLHELRLSSMEGRLRSAEPLYLS